MDAIANIMNLFIFVFCILFVNIDKTVVCTSVKSIKSLSLVLVLATSLIVWAVSWCNQLGSTSLATFGSYDVMPCNLVNH